jgi:hypothetical protein
MELALRLLLAAVLAWAGAAKLAPGARFGEALADHGIPRRARRALTVLLGATEIALAALVLTGVADLGVGVAIACLGGIFTAALLRLRLRGRRRTSCGCFGGRRSANTLLLTLRAAVLAGLGVVLATGVPATDLSVGDSWQAIAIAMLAVLVTALALAVLALYRQVGVLSLRLVPRSALELEDEGPPLGQPAPLLPDLTRRGSELVAFVSLDCRMCIEILPGLRALQREGVPVHWLREDRDGDAFERWGVPGTPYVVHLIDGTVRAKGLVNTLEQIDWVIDLGTERARLAA